MKIIIIIKLAVFCGITIAMIVGMGTLFRQTDDITNRIYAFHRQPEDTIDVAFLGTSSVQCGWSSVEAYNNYGFTSWGWATNGQPTHIIAEYIIHDIQRTQSPRLYVIGCNTFYSPRDAYNEGPIRQVVDNLSSFFNKQEAIRALMPYRADKDVGILDYTFSFLRFHSSWETYLTEGFPTVADLNTMGTRVLPSTFDVKEIRSNEYDANTFKALTEHYANNLPKMLSWLRENEIPVLFVLFPRNSTKGSVGRYNTVEVMVKEYGFDYLNLSAQKAEIGLDLTRDFRDGTHMNYWGMTKTTNYLADYLCENYDLPDHRNDPAYAAWDESYEHYLSLADEYIAAQTTPADPQ